MKIVKLGKYTKIRTGKLDANASSDDGKYPFFTCAIKPIKIDSYSYDTECVLVAGNGDLNVKYYFGKFDAYQRTYIVESLDKNTLNVRYLYHFMERYISKLRTLSIGGVIKYIKLGNLTDAPLPLLPLEEQKRIAAILDDVDESIRLRKASIDALDELIQSTFISMFGDPVTNPMGWDVGKLGDHTSKIGSGSTPRGGDKSYISEGIPLVRSLNVHNGEFRYKRLAFIDEEQAKRLKNVILQTNDVLLNITGASVARVCRVPEQISSGRVNQHVAIIRPTKKISPVYLERVLLNSHMKAELLGIGESGGATRQAITKDQILKIEIPIPPLEKQLKFTTAVDSIEERKTFYTHQLKELENLFGSLQQRAFKGEL